MISLKKLLKDKREILEDMFMTRDGSDFVELEIVLEKKEKEIVNHPDYISLYHEYTKLNLFGHLKIYGFKLSNTTNSMANRIREFFKYINGYIRR